MRARALAAACVVASVGLGAEAAESPRTSSLAWVRLPGAESCIGARELEVAVEERLGRTVFVPPAQATVFIEGRVEPSASGPGFQGHLTLADDHRAVLGSRDLETSATSCRALDEQLTLVVALLIDPDGPPAKAVAPGPLVTPPPKITPRVDAPDRVDLARKPWRASLEVGPTFAVGLLPGAAVGLTFRAELTPPSFLPIEVGGTFWLDGRADQAGRGSVLSLAYGQLGLCPLDVVRSRTRVVACAALEIGSIRAAGYGFHTSESAAQLLALGALEGRIARRIVGPVDLGLGVGVTVPFDRARFYYLDAGGAPRELYRLPPIAGVLAATVGVAFP